MPSSPAGGAGAPCNVCSSEGQITADYPVPCRVTSYDRAVELSVAENSGRAEMHPADQFEAFRALVDAGQSVEDVAARFGVAPLVVQRRLKLANVAPAFIALYRRADEATLEHLMALGRSRTITTSSSRPGTA